eukprot:scaffold5801_cov242-Prasinococcus_capsulatus_cf.AAC.1
MESLGSSLEDLRDAARERDTKANLPEIQPLTAEQRAWRERNVSSAPGVAGWLAGWLACLAPARPSRADGWTVGWRTVG